MLNKEQEKAVYTKEPFLFLLAGAGTGKTSVIVARIKHLINTGIAPEKILAITFTRRASAEMKKRINNRGIAVHTFHQFCFQTLKKYVSYQYQIMSGDCILSEGELLEITTYKNSLYQKKKPKSYEKYETFLKENRMKDFDDLLLDFHYHFHQFKQYVNYKYVFIDEFQDTNLLQYKILKKITEKKTHVFCVGDPDQSIYKFRGADAKIINKFIKDYKAKVLTLTKNYRSTKHILKLANSLIKVNNNKYSKRLITDNNDVYEQKVLHYTNQETEAIDIIKRIKNHMRNGVKINEIAVLFRNHSRCFSLRKTMNEMDVNFNENSGNSAYDSGVKLLSLHQAKGLEFSVVFIMGLEQGILPSYHSKLLLDLEEERRLFFVGITRAKKYLYVSYVSLNNDAEYVKKSLFLTELKKVFLSIDKSNTNI